MYAQLNLSQQTVLLLMGKHTHARDSQGQFYALKCLGLAVLPQVAILESVMKLQRCFKKIG